MKQRGILFKAEMVRAIIEGRKTQTRRIMKPQPQEVDGVVYHAGGYPNLLPCPQGEVGDWLWVRETWRPKTHNFPTGHPYEYRATAEQDGTPTDGPWKPSLFMPRAASRITLQITEIRVERLNDISEADAIAEGIEHLFTEKEIEQNPELSLSKNSWKNYLWHGRSGVKRRLIENWEYQYSGYKDAKGSYASLWESINGEGSWALNPYVWVIKFDKLPF